MNLLKKMIMGLALLIVIVVGINVPDEELVSEAQDLTYNIGSPPTSGRSEKDNAYFAILGFEAPEGVDIVEAGQLAHAVYYDTLEDGPPGTVRSLKEIIGSPLTFVKTFGPNCTLNEPNCLALYEQNHEQDSRLLTENEQIMQRYQQLAQYSYYHDLMRLGPWSSWVKLQSAVYSAHALNIAEAVTLFTRGEHQKGLELTVEDIVLWRKLLAGSGAIDGKTFASLALDGNYKLLEEMLALDTADGLRSEAIKGVLAPLTPVERSLDLVFDRDLQALYWSLNHYRWPFEQADMSLLERRFFKINATLNDAYEIFDALKKVSRADPGHLDNKFSILDEMLSEAEQNRPDMIYNPLGKLFIATSFDRHVARNWNNRMTALDSQIAKIRNNDIPTD